MLRWLRAERGEQFDLIKSFLTRDQRTPLGWLAET